VMVGYDPEDPLTARGVGQIPARYTTVGRPYDDGTMIKLAYAYEQATRHRRPPASTPPL
jgi:amidase